MMIGSKSLCFLRCTLCFLIFFSHLFDAFASPTNHLCRPDQTYALLEFKDEFQISKPEFSKTGSWNNTSDCCSWDGVTCDAESGEVIGLDLNDAYLNGPFKSNSSLFRLRHLRSLNLAFNNFSFSPIPSSLFNLSLLASLDLSSNGFAGEVPSSIGNLHQLTSLNLASNKLSGNLPRALLNLTGLSYVDLSLNQFTGSLPSNISTLAKLEYFYARGNSFSGTLPSSLFTIPSLLWLDLNDNNFSGPVEFGNTSSSSKLEYLLLGHNSFDGQISGSISRLVNLQFLDFSRINTSIKFDLSVLSPLKLLYGLSLSQTHVSTKNMNSTLSFQSRLTTIRLSACYLSEFPDFLMSQEDLSFVAISYNNIQGKVPKWLWRLPQLIYLDLSVNSFDGFEGSPDVLRGTQIFWLDVSSNKFQGPLPIMPQSLQVLFAFSNNFIGEIPPSLCKLISPEVIDLSYNHFNGSIPNCLGDFKNSLSALNLRDNNLSGTIPDALTNASRLSLLDFSDNQLVGKLPRSLINCSSLELLNVGGNKINDTFPFWLRPFQNLQVLVLRSNRFYGPIHFPGASFDLPTMRIIDISDNDFTGTFPSNYFANWSAMSSLRSNESNAEYMDNDPYNKHNYYSMILRNKGEDMLLERILTIYTAIDFSGNRFQGHIPESVGLLQDLVVLNLSGNGFTGNIPPSLANMTQLQSLDLSRNQLSGEIPMGMGSLSFLSYMNLSHNKLVGPIPQGTQFQRQPCSAFLDNLGLHGPPLDQSCSEVHTPTPQQHEAPDTQEGEEDEEEVISSIAAAVGVVPGLVFGWTIGYIATSYKHEWFAKIFGLNKHRRSAIH